MLESSLDNGAINLSVLHILDLAQNNLLGGILDCTENLTILTYSNNTIGYFSYQSYFEKKLIMVTKGKELEYGSNLIFINNIDLSRNSLMGEILDELTRLVGLGTLNLSMNHLTRNVPKNIGNLRWLETLDLSKNSLSRHIPESMSSLSSLAHLNLSLNNLIGRIPSSN